MRSSTISKILSESCKRLKTLDLRNMFIDTSDCEKMTSMVSLTLQCVKVTGGALHDINEMMPNLQTLALRGVFGVRRGNLTFRELKVLFLGLFTPANDFEMDLPRLEELQVKMKCPQKLHITAPALKYVTFNLEVKEPFTCAAPVHGWFTGASVWSFDLYNTLKLCCEESHILRSFFFGYSSGLRRPGFGNSLYGTSQRW